MSKEKLAAKDYERVYKEPTEEILKLVEIERAKGSAFKRKEDMMRKMAEQNKRIEEQKAMMKKREQQVVADTKMAATVNNINAINERFGQKNMFRLGCSLLRKKKEK